MPYPISIELKCIGEQQTTVLNLTGNLAQYEAGAVVVNGLVGKFKSV